MRRSRRGGQEGPPFLLSLSFDNALGGSLNPPGAGCVCVCRVLFVYANLIRRKVLDENNIRFQNSQFGATVRHNSEMVENGTRTYHLECLGGVGPKWNNMTPNQNILSVWAPWAGNVSIAESQHGGMSAWRNVSTADEVPVKFVTQQKRELGRAP